MRVLVTTWVFPTYGGVFFFLDKLIPALKEKGYDFHLVAIEPSPEARGDFSHLDPKKIHHVAQIPLPRPLSYPLIPFILRVVDAARESSSELIFCQDAVFSGFPSLVASKLLDLPLIMADHGLAKNIETSEYWENFGFKLHRIWRQAFKTVIRWIVKEADAIYSPGPDIESKLTSLSSHARRKTQTFPIGIDTDLYRPDDRMRIEVRGRLGLKDEIVGVFVGRLDIESGLQYLVRAIPLVSNNAHLKILIVGDGSMRQEYEEQANSIAPGVFIFVGYSDRVHELLNAADFFVFPKIFAGGYSIALREAMSTAVAPIATAGVDSHDDIITDQVDGLLVPPRDPEALATAINSLLSSGEPREEMGRRARQKIAERFSLASFVEKMDRLLMTGSGHGTRE